MHKKRFLYYLLFLCQACPAHDTIFMSVLSSRQHRWGQSQNPALGLFLSRDQGNSWQHSGWRESVRIFYAEQGADRVIWCAAGNGVLRSRDQGKSWKITTDWRVTEVLKVKVAPNQPSTVFAATAYGVFKTMDEGDHWQKILDHYTADVLLDPDHPGTVLAGQEEGVFISRDDGLSWQPSGLPAKGIRTLAQPTASRQSYWVGTEEDGVFVSTDQGRSWQARNQGLKHLTVYAIAFHPQNDRIVYLGTHEGGVYRSLDGGNTWKPSGSGLNAAVVHCLAVLPSHPDLVLAGTINAGLFQSLDAGKTWTFNSQPESHVWGLYVR